MIADAELALALGRLFGSAKAASRPTPGTLTHSKECSCWSCKLRRDVDFYEDAITRHRKLWPGGDPIDVA